MRPFDGSHIAASWRGGCDPCRASSRSAISELRHLQEFRSETRPARLSASRRTRVGAFGFELKLLVSGQATVLSASTRAHSHCSDPDDRPRRSRLVSPGGLGERIGETYCRELRRHAVPSVPPIATQIASRIPATVAPCRANSSTSAPSSIARKAPGRDRGSDRNIALGIMPCGQDLCAERRRTCHCKLARPPARASDASLCHH
jgi:hypothetical protein